MYIKSVEIKSIRSINYFKMDFEKPAGWHVLIGDNGAGKSSIIRGIALGLVGMDEISGIKPNWNNWIQWGAKKCEIILDIERKDGFDVQGGISGVGSTFKVHLKWKKEELNTFFDERGGAKSQAKNSLWGGRYGWFSAGYGPFRRFSGGSYEIEKVFENPNYSRLGAHLSLFGEDVALTEATKWLVNLNYKILEKSVSVNVIEDIKTLINSPDFLPHRTQLKSVSSEGVVFVDGNGSEISVNQMSDGYRSILSLTFELIRQLVRVYGDEKVFKEIRKGQQENMVIDLPGVVLIDEIDAHLHPSWQTKIGQWFTKYFPNIQFIVTTHSPLVCRACDNGSIWRLAAPGSETESGEIVDIEKNKLIYGNILDAYGTEVFGQSPARSEKTEEKAARLGKLNMLSAFGKINVQEEKERQVLQQLLSTDASII